MELNLKNHVAVVTGGVGGIGRAVARGFAAEGAAVVVWDLGAGAESVASDIAREFGVKAIAISVDVTDHAATRQAVADTIAKLGSIDHLVHAAAIGSGKFGFPSPTSRPTIGRACWR